MVLALEWYNLEDHSKIAQFPLAMGEILRDKLQQFGAKNHHFGQFYARVGTAITTQNRDYGCPCLIILSSHCYW